MTDYRNQHTENPQHLGEALVPDLGEREARNHDVPACLRESCEKVQGGGGGGGAN